MLKSGCSYKVLETIDFGSTSVRKNEVITVSAVDSELPYNDHWAHDEAFENKEPVVLFVRKNGFPYRILNKILEPNVVAV